MWDTMDMFIISLSMLSSIAAYRLFEGWRERRLIRSAERTLASARELVASSRHD